MSFAVPQIVTCPGCQQQQNFMLWTAINVSLDPGLKEKLRSGELNTFRCKHCGHCAEVVSSLLYHDMQLHWMIWLIPQGKLPPGAPDGLMGEQLSGYELRLVRSRNELIEKVNILDAGLDDRVMAALKVRLRAQLEHEHGVENPLLFFDERVLQRSGAEELRFAWVNDRKVQGILVPAALYRSIQAGVRDALNGPLGQREIWLLTDEHYVAKLLARRE